MQENEFVIVPPSPVDTSSFPLITDLQFLEPFGSESLNRKFFGITPPGIYRGFKAELPGGMALRIGRAGEAGTAIVELNNEHCLTIQQRHPVDLQVEAGFSGFVVLEGFYQFGVPTAQVDSASAIEAARILLVTQPEIRPDHVTLYALNVPAGTATLTEAMLSTEHRQDVAIAGPEAALVSERLEQHKESRDHPDASETAKGFARYATPAESTAGSEVNAAITPPQLIAAKSAAIIDAHRHAVESASGGRNTVLYDAQGNANVMVVIPRFNCEDLGLAAQDLGTGTHPAFIVNGVTKSEIFIGKYLASQAPGGCAVVAGAAPYTDIDRPTAMSVCSAKGAGWHLMSAHEWGAIQLWCLANGKQPRGNTNYGRAHDAKWETGPRLDGGMPGDVAGQASHYTGKGSASWSHDGTPSGIHDLVGNVWEWLSLLTLVDGQFKVTADNHYSLAETSWPGIAAYLDSTSSQTTGGNISVGAMQLAPSVTRRTGPVGNDANDNPYNYAATIASLAPAAGYVSNQLLRRLGIEQCAAAGAIWSRNYGTRAPLRGGGWGDGVSAGLGALNLKSAPAYRGGSIGFRPAFVSP